MKVGIVGHAQDKFTPETEKMAREVITRILTHTLDPILVSGHCHLGGVDIYAEQIAEYWGIPMEIKTPRTLSWNGEYGFKARNLDIARTSDFVHVVVVRDYPEEYTGRRFKECYHCSKINLKEKHVKSGGCWTAIQAKKMGKKVAWHIIGEDGIWYEKPK